MATNGTTTQGAPPSYQYSNASTGASEQSGGSANNNLGKDEIAWFFVEQYYTTLSKTSEKLHLFYSKRSQFVYGQEAEVAEVSVGRQNIQERIKALDLQDTKVRITNVDSQSSHDNIVIQVIGETSNKVHDEPKKFVQTFVLAQQPSGYFVLNDILRYLDEEGDEEQGDLADQDAAVELPTNAPAEVQEEPEAKAESVAEEHTPAPSSSIDANIVVQKLEEVSAESKDAASTNGDDAADATAEIADTAPPESAPAAEAEPVPDPEETARELEEEDLKEPEKPADPSPTPAVTRQPPPAQPAAPPQPSKPMSWASRVAANVPRPAVPLPKTATPPAATQARAAAPTKSAAAPSQPTENSTSSTPAAKESSEWQTAGGDNKRQQRPQSISGPQSDQDGRLGYVKYVTDKVQHDELKAALAQHGDLLYFDINRAKSCAFVEFATPAGYQAAAAANPHVVNGENITVEARRPRGGAYGGANYNTGRGNMANRGGRGGFDGGRPGNQGGRGNAGGQRGGRGGVPRGRGASQATNA
ncbi:hypothetical protein BJ170DRAFT_98203 [Xylariales sp. AK1849]|nr:hypothetical protein BJ170DRAFT_98203 [Xylariales sp. AK1849]